MIARVMLIAAAILLLTSCGEQPPDRVVINSDICPPGSPAWCVPANVTVNGLHVVQIPRREIGKACGNAAAAGCYSADHHRIFVRAFESENDHIAACALGEEIRHAIGMQH